MVFFLALILSSGYKTLRLPGWNTLGKTDAFDNRIRNTPSVFKESKVAIAISVTLTPRFIRLAHGPTLTLKEIGYVEAARASGGGGLRIMLHHILPNIVGPIAVMATLWVATAIRIEASLSFLGLGTQPPHSSWGLMLKSGVNNIIISPWLAVFPGIAIMLAVMAFNMVGDGLRDALDPKLQG